MTFAQEITEVTKKAEELRLRISQLRKDDKDPLLGDLLLRNVRTKIHYAEISRDEQDITAIKNIIKDIEQELEDAKSHKETNIKEEIEELMKRGG
jgi:molecular chaperone DnaK (HSP70)